MNMSVSNCGLRHAVCYRWLPTLALVLFGYFSDVNAQAAPDNETTEAHALLAAWEAFCDELKVAGSDIIARSDGSDINVAEGFQYLAMLTGVGIEQTQYYSDGRYPAIARSLDLYKKRGLDSSDNTYRTVQFEPGGIYRIRGWRGDSTYLGFQINEGRAEVTTVNDSELEFNADGSFELYLGGEERRGQNWIALPPGADNMYIREIFIKWETESPTRLWIERLDAVDAPGPLTIAAMHARFAEMGEYVTENIGYWDGWVRKSRERSFNAFAQPKGASADGGTADNTYSGGYFSISPGEALIIELDPVESLFWNVQLGNRWFQSLDYQYRQTSLNSKQAQPDSDGKYRFVIAHNDPGIANWLDTAGHDNGVMYFRWNQAKRPPMAPVVKKVAYAEISQHLPADTVRLSAEERRQVLRKRYEHVVRRFAL